MTPWWRHRRFRRDVEDDALGLLPEVRRRALEQHLALCAECRDDRQAMRAALAAVAAEPVREALPPVAMEVLLHRVEREIAHRQRAREARVGPRPVFLIPAALATAVAVAALWNRYTPPPSAEEALPLSAAVSPDALMRMERTVGREQAVRYLRDAGDVLVSVTSGLPSCDRAARRREVGLEAARSRTLLERRRLLLDAEAEHLASAAPVLEDVDRALGEVALLDPCASAAELSAIARRIEQRRLLMKIELVSRELQG